MQPNSQAPTYQSTDEGVSQADVAPNIVADPLATRPNNAGSGAFFDVAANGVANGSIPSGTDEGGNPLWLGGLCWRSVACNTPTEATIDTSDCGAAEAVAALVEYDSSTASRANLSSLAFEMTFRDQVTVGLSELSGQAYMDFHKGTAFGGNLWAQAVALIEAGSPMAVPAPAAGYCVSADEAVALLEYDTQFSGHGTLLAPAILIPTLLDTKALHVGRDGRLRTFGGNRVITQGIGINSSNDGAANIVMTGPVDYAEGAVRFDREGTRGRGNIERMAWRKFGITRSDWCAAKRICALIPDSAQVAEV